MLSNIRKGTRLFCSLSNFDDAVETLFLLSLNKTHHSSFTDLNKTFSWYLLFTTLLMPKSNYRYICYPIFKTRWENVQSGNVNMDEHFNIEILFLFSSLILIYKNSISCQLHFPKACLFKIDSSFIQFCLWYAFCFDIIWRL